MPITRLADIMSENAITVVHECVSQQHNKLRGPYTHNFYMYMYCQMESSYKTHTTVALS